MTTAAADRETRALELATESILQKLTDLRASIGSLITKLETDPHLNWHSFLDSYALISGQLNSILKNVKSDRTPLLKRYIAIPLLLSPDRDEELAKITDSRVGSFSHDLVPHYLRTKPDPEVEARYAMYGQQGSIPPPETINKLIALLEKITRDTLKVIMKEREELEHRTVASRNEIDTSSHVEDTHNLISSVWFGRNLRPELPTGGMTMHPGGRQPPPMQQQVTKAPSTIKTNIRAGFQVHPYQRN